jgi:hypothetical protein
MANGTYSFPGGGTIGAPGYREAGIHVAMKRISWGSIFAGTAVTLITQLLLSLLGLAAGLTTVNPTEGSVPATALGIGAAIWWIISSIISLFLGGWSAGRLAGVPRKFDGALHGILSWTLATFLTILFLGSMVGGLLGGAFSAVHAGLSTATQAASTVMPQMGGAGGGGGGANKSAVPAGAADSAKQAAAKAKQKLESVKNDFTQGGKAAETGEKAAHGMAKASLISFVVLLIGGVSAGLGGAAGAPKEILIPTRDTVAEKKE